MLPRGLLKEYARPLSMLLRGLDMLAVISAGILAYYYRFGHIELQPKYKVALALAALLTLVVFSFFQIYESVRSTGYWRHLRKMTQASSSVLIMLVLIAFLTKTSEFYSRAWFVNWMFCSIFLLLIFRSTLLGFLRIMRANRWNERRVIVIGAGELGNRITSTMQQALWTGFRIVGVFDFDPKPDEKIAGIKVLPLPQDVSQYLNSAKESIDEIWLTLPLSAEKQVQDLLYKLRHHPICIRLILDVFGFGLFNNKLSDIAGFPAVDLNSSPMIGVNRMIKAVEDRIIAAIILTIISPLMLIIAIAVKLTSKGPIIFKQRRHGWDGRLIKVYKFRTMYQHQDDKVLKQATEGDNRITPLGKFLRRTSLDELPQFINVLQGRMSIVGPRPHAVSHNELYKDSIKAYMQRHRVKPGITGWAQINGWRGQTETLEKMERRIQYDLYYIENWSLFFDLKIILLTFFQGFVNKNAY